MGDLRWRRRHQKLTECGPRVESTMARHSKRIPAWLLGLIIAVVLTAVVLVVANALGFGDDPVVESTALIGG